LVEIVDVTSPSHSVGWDPVGHRISKAIDPFEPRGRLKEPKPEAGSRRYRFVVRFKRKSDDIWMDDFTIGDPYNTMAEYNFHGRECDIVVTKDLPANVNATTFHVAYASSPSQTFLDTGHVELLDLDPIGKVDAKGRKVLDKYTIHLADSPDWRAWEIRGEVRLSNDMVQAIQLIDEGPPWSNEDLPSLDLAFTCAPDAKPVHILMRRRPLISVTDMHVPLRPAK
jgi:hypothetical protein